ncbi:MAG TPA: ABC transporter ATP-binding protein [Blastocatellia bacterium]|nr:ABC transporter ATP-binding protein [Blastocatellia bacterium]
MIDLEFNTVSKRYLIAQDNAANANSRRLWKGLNSLRRRKQEFWALRDVSFTVARGEALGIIGHNGAGKSTILKLLSGITTPTTGQISIQGRLAALIEVGSGFHPELTGRENVFLNGSILGMRRREIAEKLDSIIDFAGVRDFIDVPVKRYSSGMYVRLGFSIAAHLDPDILLLDEVLAVGDAAFQKKCLGKMSDVAQQGRTVLLVSHNMAAISSLCTHAVMLKQGTLGYFGSPQTAIEQYLSEGASFTGISLEDRRDRTGSGAGKVTGISIYDARGGQQSVIQSGSDAVFALSYSAQRNSRLNNVLFEVKFTDLFGNLLFTLSTHLTGTNFDELNRTGTIYCRVPSFPLAPGLYQTQTVMYINNDLCDVVKDAFEVSVIEGDFFGSGKAAVPKFHGSFLVPQSWESLPPWESVPRAVASEVGR